MATRFYLRTSGTPPVSPTYGAGGAWNNSGSAARAIMHINKASTTHTDVTVAGDATSGNRTHLVRQFISPKLAGQTLSGTVKAQIRCLESSTSLNAKMAISVYRVNSSGTYQDSLLAVSYSDSDTSPYEFASSATNRRVYNSSETQPITLTSRTFSSGDYLVVEIGFAENNTSTSRTATMRFGDNNATDLGDNTTDTADYCPYVQFSQDIVLWEQISGTIGSTSTVTGDLSVSAIKALEGTVTATTSVTGATEVSKLIIGTIDNTSTVGATLGNIVPIAGTISVQGSTKNKVPRNQATGTDYNQDLTGIDSLGSTLTSDTSDYHSGSRSMKAVCSTNGQGAIADTNNYVPISASTSMTVSGWAKATSQNWYIGIIQYDSSKSQINLEYQWVGSDAGWVRGSCSFTSASNGAYARPFQSSDGAGTFYFDDVQLEDGSLTDWEEPIPGGSSSVTGDLTKITIQDLAGAITNTSTVSGDIIRIMSITGTITNTSTLIADKIQAIRNISGIIDNSSTLIADKMQSMKTISGLISNQSVLPNTILNYQAGLSGLVTNTSNLPNNQLNITKNIIGIIANQSNLPNTLLNYQANLSGNITNTSNLPNNLLSFYRTGLVGNITNISNIPNNSLNYQASLSGVITNTSNLPNNLLNLYRTGLVGIITSQSNVPNTELGLQGIILKPLEGIINNTSTLNAIINVNYSLTGAITNTSNLPNNQLLVSKLISGVINGVSNLPNNNLNLTRTIIGNINIISNIPNTELLKYGFVGLDGVITNTSTLNAGLRIDYALNGLINNQSNVQINTISVNRLISGDISSISNVINTNLNTIRGLNGIINNQSLINDTELYINRLLYGAINNTTTIPNTELTIISYFTGLIGSIESHSLTTAELGKAILIIGTISSHTHVYGTLIQHILTLIETELSRIDLVITMPLIDANITSTKNIELLEDNPIMDLLMKNPYMYFEVTYENQIN